MRVILVIFFCLFIIPSYAQEKLDFGDTGTTTKDPKYKSNKRDYKQKKVIEWVKNSPQGLLLGNPCMEEVIEKMGFIYVVQNKRSGDRLTYMSDFDRFWYNFAAKFRIMLKNGPFWKFKLKKKRRECRAVTGDYVG